MGAHPAESDATRQNVGCEFPGCPKVAKRIRGAAFVCDTHAEHPLTADVERIGTRPIPPAEEGQADA